MGSLGQELISCLGEVQSEPKTFYYSRKQENGKKKKMKLWLNMVWKRNSFLKRVFEIIGAIWIQTGYYC